MPRRAVLAAVIACALALAHGTVSGLWAAGGSALLGTIGGSLEELGRAGGLLVRAGLWLVAVVKVGAGVIVVLALKSPIVPRLVRGFGWLEAIVLIGYGGVLTAVGLLVQAGAIRTGPDANRRALAWHAFFWDPWFLFWGVAAFAALLWSRPSRISRSGPSRG